MFWKKYSVDLALGNNIFVDREYPDNQSLTKGLADAFLCNDGKPISVSPLFKGWNTLLLEKENRDPRFYQTIWTPDAIWKIDGNETTTWGEAIYESLNGGHPLYIAQSGYVRRKVFNENWSLHKSGGLEETPQIIYRYAEVLLNFAEAKAELGITQADLDKSINKLRDRVNMPHLEVGNITADPNWDFPDLSPIINEVRRERRVELALEGLRLDDILRWAAADKLIYGKRFKGAYAAQYGDNAAGIPVDADGFLDPWIEVIPNGFQFKLNRDYLNPIPEGELVLNPQLKQNPGW
jgi:hypothetical protein